LKASWEAAWAGTVALGSNLKSQLGNFLGILPKHALKMVYFHQIPKNFGPKSGSFPFLNDTVTKEGNTERNKR
jgi:hypothetical protein